MPAGLRLALALLALAFLPAASPLPAAGQSAPPDTVLALPPIVADVDFAGNAAFDDEVLTLRVRTGANRRFFGVPGLTWWLWLYRLGASGALGDRLGGALMASGEPPALLDPTVLAADVERLRLLYLQEGFRDARVEAVLDTLGAGGRVDVTFQIHEGAPTYVRDVAYDGLADLTAEQQRRLVRGSLLRPGAPPPEEPLRFRARGQRYSEPTLLEERRRLLAFLRNAGYAAVSRDSIRALVFPRRPDSFDVVFRIRPGPRYRFGDVQFVVSGPQRAGLRRDTLQVGSDTAAVTVAVVGDSRLDASLLARTLQFEPGQWYDESRLQDTKRRLEATGVFAFSDIVRRAPDTTAAGAPRLPLRVELRTRERHQIRVETFMLQRSGGALADADNELGTGVGLTYENINLFGGGETFRLRTTGSIAADLDAEPRAFTSAQGELSATLSYPYLVWPFGALERRLGLYDARTRFALSVLTARRKALRLVLRGRGGARYRLELQHSRRVTSLVDLLDLSISNPDTLDGFQERFLDPLLGPPDDPIIVDPVERAQILEDYTQPQVNNAVRYTLRSARVDPLRRSEGYSYETSAEVGGNLPYLFDRFVFTPDTLEGRLPSFDGRARLLYRQYVRLALDARRYRRLGGGTVAATKLLLGLAHPTGRADVVPFDRRFYSGGANSVRGWRLRELGPGGLDLSARADTLGGDITNILGGDVKLEASLEMRQTLLRGLFVADWIGTAFVDAGNVWLGPRNPGDREGRFRAGAFYEQIGVGTGLGLRIAWDYLIVRLDLGYKAYDPARPGDGLFPDGLKTPLLHFGIGHAF